MRHFGNTRPVRDGSGAVIGSVASPAKARTVGTLTQNHGSDSGKYLVVALEAGDVITIRPNRTRRKVSIEAKTLYEQLLRLKAAKHSAEKRARRKNKLMLT